MLFSSVTSVFLFLPIVCVLYALARREIRNSRFVRGKLKAFFRPPVVEQSSIDTLIAKNMIGDFSRQRTLVIGGSRGIGLQCLRLLALGNAWGGGYYSLTPNRSMNRYAS